MKKPPRVVLLFTAGILLSLCHVLGLAAEPESTPAKLILLPDIVEPQSMRIDAEQIYICEKHKIFVYSLGDFRLVTRFGRVGDEPDAFRQRGERDLRLFLDVRGENMVIGSHKRLSLFTKRGEFIKVLAEYPQLDYAVALGSNYVGSAYVIEVGTGKSVQHAVLFDKNMEFVSEISESHLGGGSAKGFGGPDRKMHYDLVRDYFGFNVYENRIYVADSHKGFFIEVFDSTGEKLHTIERDVEKRKIPPAYRAERLDKIQNNLTYRKYKDSVAIDESEYLPAFRSFTVSDGHIYVYMHDRRDGEQEVVVLNLAGDYVDTVFLPRSDCFDIRDGKYYFVVANENGEWELRVAEVLPQTGEDTERETAQ